VTTGVERASTGRIRDPGSQSRRAPEVLIATLRPRRARVRGPACGRRTHCARRSRSAGGRGFLDPGGRGRTHKWCAGGNAIWSPTNCSYIIFTVIAQPVPTIVPTVHDPFGGSVPDRCLAGPRAHHRAGEADPLRAPPVVRHGSHQQLVGERLFRPDPCLRTDPQWVLQTFDGHPVSGREAPLREYRLRASSAR